MPYIGRSSQFIASLPPHNSYLNPDCPKRTPCAPHLQPRRHAARQLCVCVMCCRQRPVGPRHERGAWVQSLGARPQRHHTYSVQCNVYTVKQCVEHKARICVIRLCFTGVGFTRHCSTPFTHAAQRRRLPPSVPCRRLVRMQRVRCSRTFAASSTKRRHVRTQRSCSVPVSRQRVSWNSKQFETIRNAPAASRCGCAAKRPRRATAPARLRCQIVPLPIAAPDFNSRATWLGFNKTSQQLCFHFLQTLYN
jgi:hypothetical protein